MSLWSKTLSLFGVPETDQAALDAQDATLSGLNRKALDEGVYTKSIYDLAQANLEKGRIDDAEGQVTAAFQEGAKEGFDNVTGGIKGAINKTAGWSLRFIWQAIPLWVWIGLAIFALWKLGVLGKLVKAVTGNRE